MRLFGENNEQLLAMNYTCIKLFDKLFTFSLRIYAMFWKSNRSSQKV